MRKNYGAKCCNKVQKQNILSIFIRRFFVNFSSIRHNFIWSKVFWLVCASGLDFYVNCLNQFWKLSQFKRTIISSGTELVYLKFSTTSAFLFIVSRILFGFPWIHNWNEGFFWILWKKKIEFYNRKNSNHIENKYMITFTVGPVSLIGEIWILKLNFEIQRVFYK